MGSAAEQKRGVRERERVTTKDMKPESEPIPRPEDTRADVKCLVARTCMRYLEDLYGRARMESVVRRTGMSVVYLANPHNWISCTYFYRLLDALVDETGDPMAPYKQALLTNRASTSAMGSFLAHLGSPGSFYRLVVRFARLWCHDVTYRMLEFKRRCCTISVSNDLYPQTKNNCLAIQGCLAAVPTFFGRPLAELHERECACDGADACVYEIAWTEPGGRLWPLAGLCAGAAIGLAAVAFQGPSLATGITTLLASALGYALARGTAQTLAMKESAVCATEQSQALLDTIAKIEHLNSELQAKVEARTHELTETNAALSTALADLKASRKKALTAEREAAVGSLAAGMARELNNPLNALHLSIEGLRTETGDGEAVKPLFDIAQRSSQRCRRVVNDLLSCAREPNRDADVRIDQVVRSSVSTFLDEQLGNCEIDLTVKPDLPTRTVDGLQVQQALLTLLLSTTRAIEGNGRIHILVDSRDGDVVLSLTDGEHAPGARRDDRFDPTRPADGSDALEPGLAIARQIVNRNGGTVDTFTHPAGTTAVELRFPADEGHGGKDATCEPDAEGRRDE